MSYQTWEELVGNRTADGTAVANTTTETILATDTTLDGNYFHPFRLLKLTAFGRYSTTGTPTMTFRVRYGGVSGTVLAASGGITTGSAVSAGIWKVEVYIQCRSVGSSGTVMAIGQATMGDDAASTVGSATNTHASDFMGSAGVATPATATIDTTASNALSITGQWGTASASNTITCHLLALEALN